MTDTTTLIGTTEAAAILGCDRATVTRWAKTGRLAPAGQLGDGGALVFRRADVEALATAAQERAAS